VRVFALLHFTLIAVLLALEGGNIINNSSVENLTYAEFC